MVMDAVDQQPAAPAPHRPWGVAGIDPHKRTFTVAVLDERGGLHGVASFATSEQGLAVALAWLGAVGVRPGPRRRGGLGVAGQPGRHLPGRRRL